MLVAIAIMTFLNDHFLVSLPKLGTCRFYHPICYPGNLSMHSNVLKNGEILTHLLLVCVYL
jgi:hypothetical protein